MEDIFASTQADFSLGTRLSTESFAIVYLLVPGLNCSFWFLLINYVGIDKLLKKQQASGIRGGSSINVPKSLGYIAQIPGPEDVGTQGRGCKSKS